MAVELKIGKELQAIIDRMDAKAPGAVARVMERRLAEIVVDAKAAWPKRTGISARALTMKAVLEHGKVYTIIENKIGYAGAINFKGTDENVAETLVFEPIVEALPEMMEEMGEELAHG